MPALDRVHVAAGALFALLVCLYPLSMDLRATRGASITGDEPFYLLTTQSLLQDGDLDLRQQYELQSYRDFFDHASPLWTQSAVRAGQPILSPHEPGLAVYLIPGFVLGGLAGAQIQLLTTAALTFALTFILTARASHATLLAWLATLGVGLTAPAFVYATEVYPEVPAACGVALAALLLARARIGMGTVLALVALVSALPWLGTKYVPLGLVLAAAAVWRADGRGRVVFVSLCALSGAAYVAWHLATYGALTAYSASWAYDGTPTAEVVREHLGLVPRAYRLVGIFVDERFGVGRWAPLLLLTLPGLPLLVQRGFVGVVAATLFGVQLLMATFVAITMQGWWFPGRTLLTVLPLAAWVLTEVLVRAPTWLRLVVGALAVYSGAVTGALVLASRAREVYIAVDPFAMRAGLFRAPAVLFPDYRSWSAETIVLHALWTGAALVGVACCARLSRPTVRL